jgi:hypothetical protein
MRDRKERPMPLEAAKFLRQLVALIAIAPTMAAAAPAPVQPAPEMLRLIEMMRGTWATTLKFEPGDTYPKGATGTGKQVWQPGPGGLSLIEYETASTPNGPWDGMSVTWWDPLSHGFRAIWCDNHQASGCLTMKNIARWEGDKFVLGDQWQQGDKTMEYKEVQSDITPTSFVLTSYVGQAGTMLKRTLTVTAHRLRTVR